MVRRLTPGFGLASCNTETRGSLQQIADKLAAGETSQIDIQIGNMIAAGTMHGHDVARSLIFALVQKTHRLNQGASRVCSSSAPGVDSCTLSQAGFALSSCFLLANRIDGVFLSICLFGF